MQFFLRLMYPWYRCLFWVIKFRGMVWRLWYFQLAYLFPWRYRILIRVKIWLSQLLNYFWFFSFLLFSIFVQISHSFSSFLLPLFCFFFRNFHIDQRSDIFICKTIESFYLNRKLWSLTFLVTRLVFRCSIHQSYHCGTLSSCDFHVKST